MSSHQSARTKSDTYLTPPEWVEKLGPFDLDPACPFPMPWKTAETMWALPWYDGLQLPWIGRVWLNPPFGQHAVKWIRKLRLHGNGIALIPARTETEMFYGNVWVHAHAVCFVKGRPHFYYQDGTRAAFNSGAPICLVAYGAKNALMLQRAKLGIVVDGRGWSEAEGNMDLEAA